MIRFEAKPLGLLHETSKFGFRDYNGMWWHNGMDFRAPEGTPVYAVADGIVKVSHNNKGGYGLYIVLNHGRWGSLYGHLSQYNTFVGQKVKAGQLIGYTGSTGDSEAPHLHFEVRAAEYKDFWDRCKSDRNVFMRCVDPYPYLQAFLDRQDISIETAIKIVQENADLEEKTIDYLSNDYKHGEALIVKLAKAII